MLARRRCASEPILAAGPRPLDVAPRPSDPRAGARRVSVAHGSIVQPPLTLDAPALATPRVFHLARFAVALILFAVGGLFGPRLLVGTSADAWFADDLDTERGLADAVSDDVLTSVTTSSFHTGSARFDGEWAMGSHAMAVLGLAQVSLAHPELRDRYRDGIHEASRVLVDDRTYVFATDAWGASPFADLASDRGHAYLGYVALALGLARELDPEFEERALHDAMIDALVRRLEAHPLAIVETYPGEAYPCDLASIAGAIGQYDHVTGSDHHALLARVAEIQRERFVDPRSGYLVQSIDVTAGEARDAPRGSGTALAAYFWSFAEPRFARELARAVIEGGRTDLLGFSAIREHPIGVEGHGDIDSGPVVLGVSVSATGFAMASARLLDDEVAFVGLHRTATLFGVPVARGETTRFLSGGPLGNAILLAMMTSRVS